MIYCRSDWWHEQGAAKLPVPRTVVSAPPWFKGTSSSDVILKCKGTRCQRNQEIAESSLLREKNCSLAGNARKTWSKLRLRVEAKAVFTKSSLNYGINVMSSKPEEQHTRKLAQDNLVALLTTSSPEPPPALSSQVTRDIKHTPVHRNSEPQLHSFEDLSLFAARRICN